MSTPSMTLPFAQNDPTRKAEFSSSMELAAIMCSVRDDAEIGSRGLVDSLVFVSKLYYPIWAIPWGERAFLIDGLNMTAGLVLQLEIPNMEAFIDNLKRSTRDQEEYMNFLQNTRRTFSGFSSRKEVVISGFVSEKEMLSDVMTLLNDSKTTVNYSRLPNSLIQPGTNREDAAKIVSEILGHYDILQSGIKGLLYSKEAVAGESGAHCNRLQQELKQVEEDFSQQIADLTKTVGEKTRELEDERDSEIERVSAASKKKAEGVLIEKNELERELLKLEQDKSEYEKRKDLRRSKKDQVGEARWKARLQNIKKQISKVNDKVKSHSKAIGALQKEAEKTAKKLVKTYGKLLDDEKNKIVALQELRDSKMGEKNQDINELQKHTDALTKNVDALIQQVELASTAIYGGSVPLKIQEPTLIGIPLYLAEYGSDSQMRFLVRSPTIVQKHSGLLIKFRVNVWASSLESRMNSLLKPHSKQIEKLFNILKKKLEKDRELAAGLRRIGASNNLLAAADFAEKLRNGLEELENEGWIGSEEKEAVQRACAQDH